MVLRGFGFGRAGHSLRKAQAAPAGRRRSRRAFGCGGFEGLEDRRLLAKATVPTTGVLRITLDTSNDAVALTASSTTYSLNLTSGSWTGSAPTGTSLSGTTLTVESGGVAAYGTIEIVDIAGASNTSVTFNDSGSNAYQGDVNVTLSNAPGAVTFNNATRFSGSSAVSIKTASNIVFASGSSLRTVSGPLTLEANQQEPAASFTGAGIDVNNATVEATGTGAVTVKGRGGSAGSPGVIVQGSGQIKGGTDPGAAGLLTVVGRGGLFSGNFNYGVQVGTPAATTATPAIGSNGASVQVTGTGGGTGASSNNYGVYVTNGQIAAGGQGTVTVTGNGGNLSGTPTGGGNYGVWIQSSTSSITSNDGAVKVTGVGGGTGGTGGTNRGVQINSGGSITSSSRTASVTVEGTGGNSSGSSNHGVNLVQGTAPNNPSRITSGGGDVTVTGIEGSGTATRRGIFLSTPGLISTATNGGALRVITNSFESTSTQSIAAAAGGTATITSRSEGVAINLGLATDTPGGPLAISTTDLSSLAGGTLAFGSTTSGTITLSAALTVPSGSDVTLTTTNSAGVIPSATGTDLTLTGKTLRFGSGTPLKPSIGGTAVDAGYQQLRVAGTVDLTGATLALTGSYVPQAGNVFTVVSATSLGGTFSGLADGATTNFNGVDLRVHYTSSAVTLTAPTAPAITTQPISTTVNAGATASFTAAASGDPTPTVQWQVSTNGGTAWNALSGETATTLNVVTAAADDGTQYRAVFTNSLGSATSSAAILTVQTAPVITTQPTNTTAAPGATASFTVAATGNPTPTVQWQVDAGSGWANVAGATASTYSFTTTVDDNANQYRAVVTNAAGNATSNAATLTILAAPSITTQPVGGTYLPGTTTVLTAVASGSPAPTIQWQLRSGPGFSNIPGATSSSLSVPVSVGSSRQYRAVFTNSVGAEISTEVTVQAATAVTTQLTAVRTGLLLNRTTGLFEGTITITNKGSNLAALSMMLSGLTTGVVLTNATGSVTSGTQYLNFGSLAAGRSITLRLAFRKPSATTSVNYTPLFYLQA